jgi:hypothetical protein
MKQKKLKDNVAHLSSIMRESQVKKRCLRDELSDAEKHNKLLENHLVSQDWEHGRALAAKDEDSKSLLAEQEKKHNVDNKMEMSKMRQVELLSSCFICTVVM